MNKSKSVIFSFVAIFLLWLFFVGWLLNKYHQTQTPITLRSLFPIVASAIIIFVPLYKKHIKNQGGNR